MLCCIGEPKEQRERGTQNQYVATQLAASLPRLALRHLTGKRLI